MFAERDPSVIGNDYLVMGTVERQAYRASLKEPMRPSEALEQLHDFKEVWSLEFQPAGWYPDDQIKAEERARAQARAQFDVRASGAARAEVASQTKGASPPAQPAARRRKRRDKRPRKRR